MPYCDIYRVRKGLFGKAILQQYFNGDAISLPYNTSGWVDVDFDNAPAALHKSKVLTKDDVAVLGLCSNEGMEKKDE